MPIKKILDLHIHSRYSRACSKDLELDKIAKACEIKGVDIISTGDFTHPAWFNHIKDKLEEDNEGVYRLKESNSNVRFIIGTELSCIKKHNDKTRRLHFCVFSPNLSSTEKFNDYLTNHNFNLASDGRPILGLTAHEILEIILKIDERMVLIPAHAWTPWFGIFGSKGGYNSLEEAFGDLTQYVNAIETGLSSDPLMNWRLSKLDNITLVSNSDAHSCAKIGREANVFEFKNESEITYAEIMRIIKEGDKQKFLYTIEFYPEEGKYHYDGHRDCKFVCSPDETYKLRSICPKCKKMLTIGVMNRVYELADRKIEEVEKLNNIPYKSLVPLPEIIADAIDVGVNTKAVKKYYDNLIKNLGNEFKILLDLELKDIAKSSSEIIADAIGRVRSGKIFVEPGYDGEFGVVKVFKDNDRWKIKQTVLEL